MKVCEKCGEEIGGKDGDNLCEGCDEGSKKKRSSLSRKAREVVYKDLGLVKVKGSLGGTYWE